MDLSADIALFYADLAETVTGPVPEFRAFLDPIDQAAWDSARISTHSLRYQDTVTISTGMMLTIKGQAYKVAAMPLRLNGDEYTAELIRQ